MYQISKRLYTVQVKLLLNSHIKACFGIYIEITWEVFWYLNMQLQDDAA